MRQSRENRRYVRRQRRIVKYATTELPGYQVIRAYLIILGRAPDKEGLDYWTNWLARAKACENDPTVALEVMLGQFLSSSEGRSRMPGLHQHLAEMFGDVEGAPVEQCLTDLQQPTHIQVQQRHLVRLLIDPTVIDATWPEVETIVQQRARTRA